MASEPLGVIAAGHPITANAAVEILRAGGNAFDATLAAMLTACVPEAVLASIGGGGFLMAYEASSGKTTLYDFFAHTPRRKPPLDTLDFYAITADFGPATQEFHIGAGSSAVPGLVPGLFAVHQDLGRLNMQDIVIPGIRAARDGVEVSPFHAYLHTVIPPILTATPGISRYFAPEGTLLKAGEIYRNPELAQTYEALAREGADLFVHGEIGKAILRLSQENGGAIAEQDLSGYQVYRRKPLVWRHRDTELFLNPAPSAGGPLLAFGLGLLEQIVPQGAIDAPTLARVMAATNEARKDFGDDLAEIATPPTIAKHLAELSDRPQFSRGTTHISVIDAEGNAASATVTNGEGNGLVVEPYGFMLNNMLGEEDLNPQGFHAWRENTRLASMMAPTIMLGTDGTLTALGSGGSNRIRTALLQVALHLIDRGFTLEDAVTAPRMHVEKCGTLSYEQQNWGDLYQASELTALEELATTLHPWPQANMFFGGVHAVQRGPDGTLTGAGDPRREGVSLLA